MRYFLVLLLMTSMNCFGQDYKTLIAKHRKSYMEDFLNDKNSPLKQEDLQFAAFMMQIAPIELRLRQRF